jgi:hypothetical protein
VQLDPYLHRSPSGELASITYRRSWAKGRRDTLTGAECTSPLAQRVYDLRHALRLHRPPTRR